MYCIDTDTEIDESLFSSYTDNTDNTDNIDLFKETFKIKDDKYCVYYKEDE